MLLRMTNIAVLLRITNFVVLFSQYKIHERLTMHRKNDNKGPPIVGNLSVGDIMAAD